MAGIWRSTALSNPEQASRYCKPGDEDWGEFGFAEISDPFMVVFRIENVSKQIPRRLVNDSFMEKSRKGVIEVGWSPGNAEPQLGVLTRQCKMRQSCFLCDQGTDEMEYKSDREGIAVR